MPTEKHLKDCNGLHFCHQSSVTWRAVKRFNQTLELRVGSCTLYLCLLENYTSLNNLPCGKVCGSYKCFTCLEGPVCWWPFAFILGEGNIGKRKGTGILGETFRATYTLRGKQCLVSKRKGWDVRRPMQLFFLNISTKYSRTGSFS